MRTLKTLMCAAALAAGLSGCGAGGALNSLATGSWLTDMTVSDSDLALRARRATGLYDANFRIENRENSSNTTFYDAVDTTTNRRYSCTMVGTAAATCNLVAT